MASRKLSDAKLRELKELAAGWGKLLAQEAFPAQPGLDVTLADMEEIAAVATQAIVAGAVGTMAEEQAQARDTTALPNLRQAVRRASQAAAPWPCEAARSNWRSQWPIARLAVEIFFPQRPVLRIDGHAYSPTILHRILHMAAVSSSFDQAEVSLKVVGELEISDRQINNLANEMGNELARQRDQQTERFVNQPLPRHATAPATPIDLAVIFTDGGRMRTCEPGRGRGVHNAQWRETKNAAFHRMTSKSFEIDPQPELPDCFRNQTYVEKLVHGLKSFKNQGREEELSDGKCRRTSRPRPTLSPGNPKRRFGPTSVPSPAATSSVS